MEKTLKLIAFGLLHGCLLLSVVTIAQDRTDSAVSLTLTIYGSKRVCVGRPFTLKANLKNVGPKSVLIDRAGFWRYMTETALDQSSTSSTVLGAPLKIPRMRGTTADMVFDVDEDARLRVLKPSKTFSVAYAINPAFDRFYDLPGRYTVRLLYSSSLRSTEIVTVPFAQNVESTEFMFEVVKCGDQVHQKAVR